jgi:hypothetical protein
MGYRDLIAPFMLDTLVSSAMRPSSIRLTTMVRQDTSCPVATIPS